MGPNFLSISQLPNAQNKHAKEKRQNYLSLSSLSTLKLQMLRANVKILKPTESKQKNLANIPTFTEKTKSQK